MAIYVLTQLSVIICHHLLVDVDKKQDLSFPLAAIVYWNVVFFRSSPMQYDMLL